VEDSSVRKSNHFLSKLICAASLLFHGGWSFAQKSNPVQQVPSLHGAPSPSQELDVMTRRYKLDSKQRSEIKPILESRFEDLNYIASNSRLTEQQRGERTEEVRRVCNREIDAVLHDKQRMMFDHDQK
jgi:hypothetical protein